MLKAEKNTRPAIVDEKTGEKRNRTKEEIIAYRPTYRTLANLKETDNFPGPRWHVHSKSRNYHGAIYKQDDNFRDYVRTAWNDYLVSNDIILGDGWQAEAADYRSDKDKLAEEEESKKSGKSLLDEE